ncbi:MAG: ribonucleoside-diphosphate reductase subunit alpha, partial [Candidatus Micrarchaeota archaeon]
NRDGRIVDFDKERIALAIWKAAKAVGGKDKALADALADTVVDQLEKAYTDLEVPGVEEVQDMVEKVLIEGGYAKTAKAFIIYRAKRSEEREKMKIENVQKSLTGELKVKKRDGSETSFDISKVRAAIAHASTGYENDISADLISKEVIKNIYDGISTTEIETALVLASSSYIERDPAYNVVSARLFLQKLYNEASQKSISESDIETAYRKTFISGIKKGVTEKMLDAKLLEFDLPKLAGALEIDRDSNFQYLGIQTLYERYFLKIEGIRFELPQSFWMRIAMGLAINEKDRNGKALEFYELLSSMRFTSSTPTLFHSGTTSPQLSSCYLTTVMDDLKHIFKSIGDNAEMSKWSGGLGNDWSNIRATGSWIKSTKVESQGVVPFLKIANDVTVAINRSGKRRGATCAYLETWHLDIEDFLDLRKNTGDERRRTHDMNTSNWIPDLFMKRVLEDGQWTLFSPEEVPDLHHIYGAKFEKQYNNYEQMARDGKIKKFKTLSAQKLWKRMLSMLFETGHPWITFKDPCNIRSPQDHAGVIHSSNLCTEITLNTSADETAVCNLGSINLERHTHDGKIDYAQLSKTIKTAVRMLDNVIDINFYPTIEGKTSNMRHRPIGLGIMGFQDTLFKMDMNFDSEEAVQFSDRLMEFISYHA